jgi:hypothetical protein
MKKLKDLLCSLGVHCWDKYALMNGHHMCTNCTEWIEESRKKRL